MLLCFIVFLLNFDFFRLPSFLFLPLPLHLPIENHDFPTQTHHFLIKAIILLSKASIFPLCFLLFPLESHHFPVKKQQFSYETPPFVHEEPPCAYAFRAQALEKFDARMIAGSIGLTAVNRLVFDRKMVVVNGKMVFSNRKWWCFVGK